MLPTWRDSHSHLNGISPFLIPTANPRRPTLWTPMVIILFSLFYQFSIASGTILSLSVLKLYVNGCKWLMLFWAWLLFQYYVFEFFFFLVVVGFELRASSISAYTLPLKLHLQPLMLKLLFSGKVLLFWPRPQSSYLLIPHSSMTGMWHCTHFIGWNRVLLTFCLGCPKMWSSWSKLPE
jgi:hypothetical protein